MEGFREVFDLSGESDGFRFGEEHADVAVDVEDNRDGHGNADDNWKANGIGLLAVAVVVMVVVVVEVVVVVLVMVIDIEGGGVW